ncbi:MAG: class I SAM-dependent methyltransferase [Pseudomonadota bacterium]
MTENSEFDSWSAGQSYEHYMGRWSRKVAAVFLKWLSPPADADWLEIGCGTGALTNAILTSAAPSSILATDQSPEFVAHAKNSTQDSRADFKVAKAQELPRPDSSTDIVVSALVLNFIPDKRSALEEMLRVLRPGGLLSFYVWDYPGGGMGFIDAFWKAAAEVDPEAAELDESARFPFCTKEGLTQMCADVSLENVEISAIETETEFPDFEAFWHPFTLGAGPAPGYCMSLSENDRIKLKNRLAANLGTDGPVVLKARAWGVKAPKLP